jgi:hypothetical protein
MFWNYLKEMRQRQKDRPKDLPDPVGRFMVVNLGKNPDWVWRLKSVRRPRPADGINKEPYDVRVFDEGEAAARKVSIKNYLSLDDHPELILFEGWYDKKNFKVELADKKITPVKVVEKDAKVA